jgi:lipoate-protein ligase A
MLHSDRQEICTFLPPDGLCFEDGLFEEMVSGAAWREVRYCWRQSDCLVVPRRWAGRPGFEEACREAGNAGWPVALRSSGGACVFHGHNVFSVTSVLTAVEGDVRVDRVYESFSSLLIETIGQLGGVGCSIGFAPEAPCDGRFNILWGNRKLAGLAMRRRARDGVEAFLVHACIWLGGSMHGPVRAVEAFERRIGLDVSYSASACVTLEEVMGRVGCADDLLRDWGVALSGVDRLHMLNNVVNPPSTTSEVPVM